MIFPVNERKQEYKHSFKKFSRLPFDLAILLLDYILRTMKHQPKRTYALQYF